VKYNAIGKAKDATGLAGRKNCREENIRCYGRREMQREIGWAKSRIARLKGEK